MISSAIPHPTWPAFNLDSQLIFRLFLHWMKLFAFLMAFIFLFVTVLPCADEKIIHDQQSSTTIGYGHSDEKAKDDHCSPFCTCTCCTGFSINHTIFETGCSTPSGNRAICWFPIRPIDKFCFSCLAASSKLTSFRSHIIY